MTSNLNRSEFNIEKLKQGDETALKEFFDYLVPRLYHYARRQKFFEPLDMEDVVNETIFRVFKRIDSIAEIENPYAYCLAVMKNVIREHYRRSIKTRELETPLDSLIKQEDTDEVIRFPQERVAGDTALDFESASELHLSLEKALAELSAADRQLVQMRMSENSFEDIASSLGISVPSARVRYYRIIRALKHSFENHYREVKDIA